MKSRLTLTVVLALAGSTVAGEIGLTSGPKAERLGDKVRITFEVSSPGDVELAILDSGGKVVRHLAAGVLRWTPTGRWSGRESAISWLSAGPPVEGSPVDQVENRVATDSQARRGLLDIKGVLQIAAETLDGVSPHKSDGRAVGTSAVKSACENPSRDQRANRAAAETKYLGGFR